MRGLRKIKGVIALSMLLLFSISFTPKQYLHDLFANHSDTYGKIEYSHTVQSKGFQCDCNNQVVELPYILEAATIFTSPVIFHQIQYVDRTINPISSIVNLRSLRGPPAVI